MTEVAKRVAEALASLASARDGRLTPGDVVEAARPAESPLHDQFEWDDTAAAERYRLEQARALIRSVRVLVRTDTRYISTVYYTRDPRCDTDEQGYIALPVLRNDEDLAREALVAEFARVATLLRRAREMAAALDLRAEIDALIERTLGLHQRASDRASRSSRSAGAETRRRA